MICVPPFGGTQIVQRVDIQWIIFQGQEIKVRR